jgi:carbonic anhydrase
MTLEVGRRRALALFGTGLVTTCSTCLALSGLARASEAVHWSYEGHGGPEHWAELSPDFKTCAIGVQQTPIDLKSSVAARLAPVAPQFAEMPLRILNNGHTIQVSCAEGSHTELDGQRYDLVQFHFHHPSEHLLMGQAFPLEAHFVHKNADGGLAVLGVFVKPGAASAGLQPIWDAMPPEEAEERTVDGTTVRPAELLPRDRAYFRYWGSLTTPPCSEGVLWTVFREPIEASDAQIGAFAKLFPLNARPVQPLLHRFLLESAS